MDAGSRDELAGWDAVRTAEQIAGGEVTAVEVTEAALVRIEERNPSLGAVVFVDPARALTDAAAVDAALSRGEDLGPLAGVPTLVKDLYGFRPGWPATLGGIPALRDQITPEGLVSEYPRAMKDASAVMLGMSNSPAIGYRGVTDNRLFGPTRNPFDVMRNSGGSSGGSAAAVADGIVPVAGASDAGGSIRIPASWCGVVGYQPSAGLVPSTPRPNGFHLGTYIYEGPVSRTVRDAAHTMSRLHRYAPADPNSAPVEIDWVGALGGDITGLRIGYSPDFGGYPVNPKVRAVLDDAVTAFSDAGAVVVESSFRLPVPHDVVSTTWMTALGSLVVGELDGYAERGIDLAAGGGLSDITLGWADRIRAMSFADVTADRVVRTQILDAMLAAQSKVDLIVGPTLIDLPVLNASDGDTRGPSEVAGQAVDPLIGWCPTVLTNFTGAPSASVPAGLADGLPVGMLIVGRRYADAQVIAASAAVERVRPWAADYAIPAGRPLS